MVPFSSLTLPFPVVEHHGVIFKYVTGRHTTEFDDRIIVP